MKRIYLLSLVILASCNFKTSTPVSLVQNSDVHRFWKAYDMIISTDDSKKQYDIIQKEYIDKGSPGLKAIMDKRNYTAQSYIESIHSFPKFWESIRSNTLKSESFTKDIEKNIEKLRLLYPPLKPANVYFTIGALRTGGQAHQGHVLIGSELALADTNTVSKELQPDRLRENLAAYFKSNPIDDVVLLNIHEYVHTQQGDYGNDLLSMAIFEGVAEFISVLATEQASVVPAIAFGKENEEAVRTRFQKEMFSPNWNDWLYNDFENEFGVRDLGYYVGYTICEGYYKNTPDKAQAIKEIIELDCTNAQAVKDFVNKSDYLSKPYEDLKKEYEAKQPQVLGMKEIETVDQLVDANLKTITIDFSTAMNTRFRNFKLGDLGQDHFPPIQGVQWSEDNTSLILQVKLEADKRYQMIVDREFRDLAGRAVSPFYMEFTTTKSKG